MKQQINLFQGQDKQNKNRFSLTHIITLFVVSIAINLSYYFYNDSILEQNLVALHKLEKQVAKLNQLKDKLQPLQQGDNASISKRLQVLARERIQKNQILDVITKATSEQYKISTYIYSLANNTLSGLWLTNILIDRTQSSITLTGITRKSELLPEFIRLLSTDETLKNIIFQKIDIQRNEEDTNYSFTISTHK
ncbi:MAG: PilN domain-containing protein [Gammaproteobacteria bacterium]|nr:PilN domain-containing protein [Gammaproteobacteria bacterium]